VRGAVVDATVALAALYGYRSITVADIAAEAEITAGTFHTLFAHKDAVILSVLEDVLVAACAELRPHPDPSEALRLASTRMLQKIIGGRGVISVECLTVVISVVTTSPHLQPQVSALRRHTMSLALADQMGVAPDDQRVQSAVTLWSATAAACYHTDLRAGADVRSRLDADTPHRMSQRLTDNFAAVTGNIRDIDSGMSAEATPL
jgi:AcrR family transcriptional regulator